MAQVIKTTEDTQEAATIVGVGVVPAHGKGGVVVKTAAEGMAELQDAEGQPLSGKKLEAAAKKWAATYGLEVVTISDDEVAHLPQDAGQPADRPPAGEVAAAEYRRTIGENTEEDREALGLPPAAQLPPPPPEVPAPDDNLVTGSPGPTPAARTVAATTNEGSDA